ncbi:ABC transporter substrate-binding protein [Arcanobacterium sp. S3PF19]|uniref:ABC transporter substrate-binding protein n=1 Tax=Arcanobacterium sp. S3PF19 TaxID=1219585 RepID=UPI0005105C94|nr:ABC transporter substrate-binding protein [Arcanobacterium sp. S3PF19]KGF05613.1 ABC transporter substrate-binding protein [Arcanobacterium sp. S3PF19]
MSKFKRFAGLTLAAALTMGTVAACGSSDSAKGGKGKVYYLNFKPEQEEAWKKVAQAYEKEKGTKVKIVTAASGTYEKTLKTEIEKEDAPTLFNINGPVGYQNWKKYTADLKDSKIYKELSDQSLAVKDGDGVFGVPFVVEGYGIIYNDAILQKYFALPGAKAKSVKEINNFDKLKAVAEDMQAQKDKLGIKGAFASTSFAPGEDWRWQTHLANYPVYYELKDKKVSDSKKLDFKYDKEYKNILDLYTKNSTVDPAQTSAKTVTDSLAEFALGQAAFIQNGNWAWGQISGVDGNTVKEGDIHFMPIYTGVKGEEKNGLAIGTENFMSVNAKASEADQKASLDFLEWLFTSDNGKKMVAEDLGFIAPFKSFGEKETPKDPLGKEVAKYLNDKDLTTIPWVFTIFPSQEFKDGLGQQLGQYVAGKNSWDNVKKYFVTEWAAQKK